MSQIHCDPEPRLEVLSSDDPVVARRSWKLGWDLIKALESPNLRINDSIK